MDGAVDTVPPRGRAAGGPTARWSAVLVVTMAALAGCTDTVQPGPDRDAAAAPAPSAGATTREGAPSAAAAEDALPDGTAAALQDALERHLEGLDAPGATAAVSTPAGAWAGASGVDGTGVPLRPESASAIASVTKTFVAAEVLLLTAQGSLGLDDPVGEHVDLPFDPGGATVREVLGMESGFPLDPVGQALGPTGDTEREWTIEEVLALPHPRTRQGLRGGDPDYNNLNYWVLGALVEQVTGDPLAVALRRDVLDPAGLDRVWVQTAEEPVAPVAVPAEDPRFPPVDADGPFLPSRAVASAAGPVGGIAADAPTLARWGRLLYGGDVLDAALVEQMTTPEDEEDWYGLGTVLLTDGEERVVGHDGDLGVSHSLLAVWPDSGTSVAVLVPAAAEPTSDDERTPFALARTLRLLAEGEDVPSPAP